jgi:MoaA/NifB/PqqE/SkfB family radical SAM enzyme
MNSVHRKGDRYDKPMKMLLLDFVYLGELCNFRCRYCSSSKTAFRLNEHEIHQAKNNLDKALGSLKDSFLIYRFSGGEIFLLEEILAALLERSFPITQLLTNGTQLSETLLEKLQRAKDRVVVCVSLDGHTVAMNRMRESYSGMKESTLHSILGHISSLVAAGIPVEIQTVLSDANCDYVISYLDFIIDSYPTDKLMVSIFPVRPAPRGLRLAALEDTIRNFDRYRQILPSRDYMVGLFNSISLQRKDPCSVPRHISFKVLRNGFSPKYELLSYFCECGGLRYYYGKRCTSCYTHYDLYNSILGGRTDIDSIPFPLFRHPLIQAYFEAQKKVRYRYSISQLMAYGKSRIYGNSF